MEDTLPILEYLPNSFKEPGEQEYIRFLWGAFDSNYKLQEKKIPVKTGIVVTLSLLSVESVRVWS